MSLISIDNPKEELLDFLIRWGFIWIIGIFLIKKIVCLRDICLPSIDSHPNIGNFNYLIQMKNLISGARWFFRLILMFFVEYSILLTDY